MNSLKRRFIALFLFFAVAAMSAVAQEKINVSGIVTDEATGEPLIGATVTLKDQPGVGVVTGVDGDYSLDVTLGSKLTFNYVGLQEQQHVANKNKIDVSLKSDMLLEEVVVIGFGTVKKKELTGAASQVSADDLKNTVSTDVAMSLQGLVSGVSVTSSAGDPGSEANIQIRGVTSITGSNTPLFVVDGIPQDGNPNLSSNEIATMDILKDAASCAVYGTRGAAGVILITTKQGEAGKLRVSLDAVYGLQNINYDGLPDVMNADQQIYYSYINTFMQDGMPNYDNLFPGSLKKGTSFLYDTDAIDVVLKEGMRPEQSYNVTLSGGSKELTYSAVLGYYGQDGMVVNSGFQRYNFRNNLNYNKDKLKITFSTAFTLEDKQKASGESFSTALNYYPYWQTIDRDMDTFYVSTTSQALDVQKLARQFQGVDETNTAKYSGTFGLDYELLKGLVLSTKAGVNYSQLYTYKYNPTVTIYTDEGLYSSSATSSVTNSTSRKLSLNWYGSANYTKTFNKDHKLTATAVASYEQYSGKGFSGQRENVFSTSGDAVLGMATGEAFALSQNNYTDRLFGVIARGQYSYKGKYMLSGSIRADASSKFAAENRWGYFPSISAGWNVSDEPFWEGIKDSFNAFKIRASYGTTGNQSFDSYSFSNVIVPGYDYVFDGSLEDGNTQKSYANENVKWETSVQSNVGFDMAFLKNRITFSTDIYHTDKRDMLAEIYLPTSTGTEDLVIRNIGNMVNKGIELTLGFKGNIGKDFTYGVSANYSKNINEITKLNDTSSRVPVASSRIIGNNDSSCAVIFQEGYEAGAFFLYETNGVIKTHEQLELYRAKVDPTADLGDLIYIDQDGDKQITTADRTYAGSGTPEHEFGLSGNFRWKGFDFSTQWYASIGNEIINGPELFAVLEGRSALLPYEWTTSNPDSNIPYYSGSENSDKNYNAVNDLFLEDGSFIRMKAITLGYTLPKNVLKNLRMSSARVYVTGQNLLTFTGYTGLDPEIGGNGLTSRGIDKGGYPLSKKVMVGVKVQF